MAGRYPSSRRSWLDGAHHDNEPTAYDAEAFADYGPTPFLTGFVQFATVIGTFVGVWTAILLAGDWHRGLGVVWPLILILTIDVGVNVALRVARARRWRALGVRRSRPLARRARRH
jgi:hypothetical protein